MSARVQVYLHTSTVIQKKVENSINHGLNVMVIAMPITPPDVWQCTAPCLLAAEKKSK
jgi:hypothetical protein